MIIEDVFEAVSEQFPDYPLPLSVVRAVMLATLDAIREPSEKMLHAGRAGPELTLAAAFKRMIDALKLDVAG